MASISGTSALVTKISLRADGVGIDQLSGQILIGEEQSAEVTAASFQIGPADHDKFLAMEAFDLAP
jgi:hypothetical protein